MNLYAYVGNDPMNATDPDGKESATTHLGLTPGGFKYGTPEGEADIGNAADGSQEGIVAAASIGPTGRLSGPMLRAGINNASAVASQRVTSKALAAAERSGASGLRRAAEGAVNKIRDIIKNNGKMGDFLGASRESRGVKTGFDHITEMKNSIKGLEKAAESLGGSLKNPKLTPEVRSTLESWKKAADTAIEQMRKTLER